MKKLVGWLGSGVWCYVLLLILSLVPSVACGAGGSWKGVGSGLATSDVLSLAIDPASQTIYAGTNGGGVFKSVAGGQWLPAGLNDSALNTAYVESLAIDTPSQTLYAGTDSGLFRSTDGGDSWSAINSGLSNGFIKSIVIDAQNPLTVYAGSNGGGVFKSVDGGGSWSQANSGLTTLEIYAIAIDPANSSVIYAGTFGGGVFKSTDGGGSWSASNSGLTNTSVTGLVISGSGGLYAGTYSSGVFKSTDGGNSWSAINSGINLNVRALAVHPVESQTIYGGTYGGGVFVSTDAGASWSGVNTALPNKVRALVIDPTSGPSIYAGTSSGVYRGLYPALSGVPGSSVTSGNPYSFTPAIANATSVSIVNPPRWASFDSATGALTGRPGDGDIATYENIVISAANSVGSVSLAPFSITVKPVNHPPTISGTPTTSVMEGTPYYFAPTASDPDADRLTFGISSMPAWATFDAATGTLSGTPPTAGSFNGIRIWVSDGVNTTMLPYFSIAVTSSNHPPVISGTPSVKVITGTAYSFTPTATDSDPGDSLSFSISNKPEWADFDTTTGTLRGIPTVAGQSGSIVISVTDGKATSYLKAFSITVSLPNNAPTISGTPAVTAAQGSAYSFTPTAYDPDSGDLLRFSISGRPSWASFDTTTGTLSGTATTAGIYSNIKISVTDGTASVSLPTFSITVTSTNHAPTISGVAATSVVVGTPYSFTPTASDADRDALTFSIYNKPDWASFDAATGTLSGTPTATGSFTGISISVSDGSSIAYLAGFSINVVTLNHPPTISGTPATNGTVGTPYSFTPIVSDADGDTLLFSIVNKPPWATFDTATGTLAGTPSATGTYSNIAISVSDGKVSAPLPPFTIVVTGITRSPAIWGTPREHVATGIPYSFTPSSSGPDNTVLTFSIVNKPSWASFDSTTGTLSGTPTDAGAFYEITISVTDGTETATLPPFPITVVAAGDCDGSGAVGIAEVQTAINSYLGLMAPAPCVDLDDDGAVTISEVQKVINGYLGL